MPQATRTYRSFNFERTNGGWRHWRDFRRDALISLIACRPFDVSHVIFRKDLQSLTLMQVLIDTARLEGGISLRELFRLFLVEVGIARSTSNAPRSCNMAETNGLVPSGDAQVSRFIISSAFNIPRAHNVACHVVRLHRSLPDISASRDVRY